MPMRRSHERQAMLKPPQVAALLIVAILAVCSFGAGFGRAMADPTAASREAPQATPKIGRAAAATAGGEAFELTAVVGAGKPN